MLTLTMYGIKFGHRQVVRKIKKHQSGLMLTLIKKIDQSYSVIPKWLYYSPKKRFIDSYFKLTLPDKAFQ